MKPAQCVGDCHSCLASLPGNGGRGLKQEMVDKGTRLSGASLPGNGGRGLKQVNGGVDATKALHRSPATGGVD